LQAATADLLLIRASGERLLLSTTLKGRLANDVKLLHQALVGCANGTGAKVLGMPDLPITCPPWPLQGTCENAYFRDVRVSSTERPIQSFRYRAELHHHLTESPIRRATFDWITLNVHHLFGSAKRSLSSSHSSFSYVIMIA
jgi:hypothetical protein